MNMHTRTRRYGNYLLNVLMFNHYNNVIDNKPNDNYKEHLPFKCTNVEKRKGHVNIFYIKMNSHVAI